MNYKEKLKQFNSTDKYRNELDLMIRFISQHRYALDYGCGTGFMSEYINRNTLTIVKSYDVNNYVEHKIIPMSEGDLFGCIFFNHSFAHITLNDDFFNKLKELLISGGEIIINTPNKLWLDLQSKENYKPDDTVINHYTQEELINIFISKGFKVKFIIQYGSITQGINERILIVFTYE